MSARLLWDGRKLLLVRDDSGEKTWSEVAEVRRAPDGWVYESKRGFIIQVSNAFRRIGEARVECRAEVATLLRRGGVLVSE